MRMCCHAGIEINKPPTVPHSKRTRHWFFSFYQYTSDISQREGGCVGSLRWSHTTANVWGNSRCIGIAQKMQSYDWEQVSMRCQGTTLTVLSCDWFFLVTFHHREHCTTLAVNFVPCRTWNPVCDHSLCVGPTINRWNYVSSTSEQFSGVLYQPHAGTWAFPFLCSNFGSLCISHPVNTGFLDNEKRKKHPHIFSHACFKSKDKYHHSEWRQPGMKPSFITAGYQSIPIAFKRHYSKTLFEHVLIAPFRCMSKARPSSPATWDSIRWDSIRWDSSHSILENANINFNFLLFPVSTTGLTFHIAIC